ncbi:hypothetical protein OHB12_17385 [Nocardia sp. NBC_01730]|uniref:hypothetical protein n=1 Tax=Nocardia sp. NBC_01730 TaxID=2975998 RepID=UPI002E1656D8|nr:hypothetical protein OHB12_17385 [Nocardia sp. NBC_01730]
MEFEAAGDRFGCSATLRLIAEHSLGGGESTAAVAALIRADRDTVAGGRRRLLALGRRTAEVTRIVHSGRHGSGAAYPLLEQPRVRHPPSTVVLRLS